jgi:hypothetical protein
VFSCSPPPGHVANDDDCDDGDPLLVAPGDFWFDEDGDGYGAGVGYGVVSCTSPADGWVAMELGEDCVPDDPAIHPDAPEVCEDGIDQDCDGLDEGCCVSPKPDCDALVYETSCYLFCRDSKDWEDARDFCFADGGHLLTVNDADEEAWADATVDVLDVMHGIVGSYWWIGFNDRAVEGVWEWVDGTPVSYTDWYAGEPNNVGNEDCAQIDQFDPFLGWNDQSCAAINRYICER